MVAGLGLLLLRLVVGLLLAAHGAQKLFGWFGGPGFTGTQSFFGGQLRLRPAPLWTAMGAVSELGGGLLLALGLLSPLGSLGAVATVTMAIVTVHWPRIWDSDGGMDYPLTVLAAALAIGLTGPGRWSMDSLLHLALPEPLALVTGLVVVAFGVAMALVTRLPLATSAGVAHQPGTVER